MANVVMDKCHHGKTDSSNRSITCPLPYPGAGPIFVSCRGHAAGPFVLLMPKGAKFDVVWTCPQRSPRPGLWLTYYPIQTTDCLTNKKMSQSSNQADFSRGREQQGEENWQEGELGEEISRKAITSQSGGIKRGTLGLLLPATLKLLIFMCWVKSQ